jgi:NADP-dependent aldehyde dehydrogenase
MTQVPHPILVNGQWRPGSHATAFSPINPSTGAPLSESFPVSDWSDCDAILTAAASAFSELRNRTPDEIALFLETYASLIEADKEALVEIAHQETGLPKAPRLGDVELPRTVGQLRQAAAAARQQSWSMPTIDTKANIRSCFQAIGPVGVFGPNNFPFAFNSIAGGDFAAAIAAGNPVIAKANSSHPATTYRFALLADKAAKQTNMPSGLVQLIYRTSHPDGERLVADPRLSAIGYTGARNAGLQLKAAADRVGKPFYAELSSVNPVVFLPGAFSERLDKLIDEYVSSGLMGTGQFCTNPGMLLMVDSEDTSKFISAVTSKYQSSPCGTLLSRSVETSLLKSVAILKDAGAELLTGGTKVDEGRCSVANTVLRIHGKQFLSDPHVFQTEAFGNAVLIVVCKNLDELVSVIEHLEGNLTGSIYSDSTGADDADYNRVAGVLTHRVGRILNDKMPTGVAVSPAMNHGGPFPATGHPGFTAVGIPASLVRFAKLTCFDAVRESRLPVVLQNANALKAWRLVDGNWSNGSL